LGSPALSVVELADQLFDIELLAQARIKPADANLDGSRRALTIFINDITLLR
jgi:hypothetical protein